MTIQEAAARFEPIREAIKNGTLGDGAAEAARVGELVLDFLESFEEDDEITVRLREFMQLFSDTSETLKTALYALCDDEKRSHKLRFFAFYTAYTLLRRRQNYREIGILINQYRRDFSDEPLFDVVLSTYYRFTGGEGSRSEIEKALKHAERAFDNPKIQNVQGVRANFAETVTIAGANGVHLSNGQISKAEGAVEEEIRKKPTYGKYYYIRAKLHLIRKKYTDAIQDVDCAIEYEDKNGKDAFIRIPEYIGFKYEIKQTMEANALDEKILELGKKTQLLSDELNENRTKIIEYITFFSGIIAFIVSTVQISLNANTFSSYVGLLLVMSSLLMLSFSSFMVITHGLERKGIAFAIVLVPIVGVLILGLAIGFGWTDILSEAQRHG